MSDQGGGNPAPGWYDDPERPGYRRWWDGMAWTDHSEPIGGLTSGPPPVPGSAAAGPPTGGPPRGTGTPGGGFPAASGAPGAAPKIDTWLWQSIVVTVLCCLPLGIPAIVFASQANSELSVGNHAAAQEKARMAKTFTLIGFGVGLVVILGWASVVFLPFVFMGF